MKYMRIPLAFFLAFITCLAFVPMGAVAFDMGKSRHLNKISLGHSHSAVITTDGDLFTWGNHANGRLGLGDDINRFVPTNIQELSNVVSVSLGDSHSAAITATGDLYTWGYNVNGELGLGDTNARNTPTKIQGLSDVIAVSSGGYHWSAAVTADGDLYTWGYNVYGQLGLGDTDNRYTPTKVQGLSNVVAISSGYFCSAAITADGDLYTWGYNDRGQLGLGDTDNRYTPTKVQGLSNVKAVSISSFHGAAITTGGELYTWGSGADGLLGLGDLNDKYIPTKVQGLSSVVSISLGYLHSAAVTTNGDLYTWGYGGNGRLGLGDTENRDVPTKVQDISSVVDVSLGNAHSSVITENGYCYSWGHNFNGQLGDGTTTDRNMPVQVVGENGVGYFNLGGAGGNSNIGQISFAQKTYGYNISSSQPQYLYVHVSPSSSPITWESDNSTVVTIPSSNSYLAKIETVGTGTATITASTNVEGQKVETTCQVVVYDAYLDVADPKITLSKGETTNMPLLCVTYLPQGHEIKYVSENESIATISERGVITASGVGKVTVKTVVKIGKDIIASFPYAVTVDSSLSTKVTPIVFGDFVDLKYPKNLLFFDNKDVPPIPTGNNSKYIKELKYWADELGYDFSALDFDQALTTPFAMPYMRTTNEIVFNSQDINNPSKTVKDVMSDIIMLGKLQEYIIKEEKKVIDNPTIENLNSSAKTLIQYLGRYNEYVGSISGQRYDPRTTTKGLAYISSVINTVWGGNGRYDDNGGGKLFGKFLSEGIYRDEKYDFIMNGLENANTNQSLYNAQNDVLKSFSFGSDVYKAANGKYEYYYDIADTVIDNFGPSWMKSTMSYTNTVKKIYDSAKLLERPFGAATLSVNVFSKYLDFCVGMHSYIKDQYPSWLFFSHFYLSRSAPEYFTWIGFDAYGKMNIPYASLSMEQLGKVKNEYDKLSYFLISTTVKYAIENSPNNVQNAQLSMNDENRRSLIMAAVTLADIRLTDYREVQRHLLDYISAQCLPTGNTTTAQVSCPVDVSLIDEYGNELFFLANDDTYDINYNEYCSFYLNGENRDEKVFIYDDAYSLVITPYDNGEMNCLVITTLDDGTTAEYSFEGIPVDVDSTFVLLAQSGEIPALDELSQDGVEEILPTSVSVFAKSLSLSHNSLDLGVSETQLVNTFILPIDLSNESITWASSNTSVVNVNGSGLVTGVSPGRAYVSASLENSKLIATCEVFVQPSADDIASIAFEAVGKGNISTSLDEYYLIGDKVTICAIPDEGHRFVKWTTSSGGVIGDSLSEYTNVTILADTLVVTAFFEQDSTGTGDSNSGKSPSAGTPVSPNSGSSLTIISSANGAISISPENPSSGGKVTITVTPNAGFELDELEVADKDGNNIPYTKNSNGTHSFTMPNSDITISATFSEIAWSNPFADVFESAWYYNAVKYAYENNIMQGTGNGLFEPSINLDRAMMVQILYNLKGQPNSGIPSFTDVANGAWYADAIAWSTSNGIVSGIGDNRFAPEQNITREQMAVMLYNYCIYEGIKLPVVRESDPFSDKAFVSSWASEAVEAMYKTGILNGKANGAFDPQGDATRAEVAQMFMNFKKSTE